MTCFAALSICVGVVVCKADNSCMEFKVAL